MPQVSDSSTNSLLVSIMPSPTIFGGCAGWGGHGAAVGAEPGGPGRQRARRQERARRLHPARGEAHQPEPALPGAGHRGAPGALAGLVLHLEAGRAASCKLSAGPCRFMDAPLQVLVRGQCETLGRRSQLLCELMLVVALQCGQNCCSVHWMYGRQSASIRAIAMRRSERWGGAGRTCRTATA